MAEKELAVPIDLVGQVLTVFCLNYFYTGRVLETTPSYVKLDDPAVIYEIGEFSDDAWKDAQKLSSPIYIKSDAIESFAAISKAIRAKKTHGKAFKDISI